MEHFLSWGIHINYEHEPGLKALEVQSQVIVCVSGSSHEVL